MTSSRFIIIAFAAATLAVKKFNYNSTISHHADLDGKRKIN